MNEGREGIPKTVADGRSSNSGRKGREKKATLLERGAEPVRGTRRARAADLEARSARRPTLLSRPRPCPPRGPARGTAHARVEKACLVPTVVRAIRLRPRAPRRFSSSRTLAPAAEMNGPRCRSRRRLGVAGRRSCSLGTDAGATSLMSCPLLPPASSRHASSIYSQGVHALGVDVKQLYSRGRTKHPRPPTPSSPLRTKT